jgi:2-oxoisovalerate dehydrogenase E1 component
METSTTTPANIPVSPEVIIEDYHIAYRSRYVSLVGRREVMSGKAKFGIFGDGKEICQIALAKVFQSGDFRSGYYRDQTLMFALGALTIEEFFAQLYAHADVKVEPATAGRAMNAHFATRSINADGSWKPLCELFNSSADISPTGSQMPRLVGLGYASKLFRELKELHQYNQFSNNGNEIAFGTIGNASTTEGMFWEAINAIGVLKIPVVISIWDDGYGISVPNQFQMINGNISKLLKGFERNGDQGFDIYNVKGWDYLNLIQTYQQAVEIARGDHIPSIIHVSELTQPQGHSTSGSHERYKTKARLNWEIEHDCISVFKEWIISNGICSFGELEQIELEERERVEESRKIAWHNYLDPIKMEREQVTNLIQNIAESSPNANELTNLSNQLNNLANPLRRDIQKTIQKVLIISKEDRNSKKNELVTWKNDQIPHNHDRYSSYLYSQTSEAALNIKSVDPEYSEEAPEVYGFEILNACFDAALARDPRVVAFGEDVGNLGDVNQGFRGLQEKYGKLRVSDTGIRETTIIGQAIGLAMRGLRPIAEIQYLDYLLYALQIISDDLATLHWRTKGGQKAPVIIRTRGHRLEGIWHSGSPMAGIINLVRGLYVLVPRNMTQAAGFYNCLLKSDDPALMIEVLNGYRQREKLPTNIGEFLIPIGVPETLRSGEDITIVTYGACCRIVMEASELLSDVGVDSEVIDVRSLLPFDLNGLIKKSLKKTNRILFVDEDVPGGATAYMMQEVIENQGGYFFLDSQPQTLTGKPHRPAYGSDGDYWSKPNVEQVFDIVYKTMNEVNPRIYPTLY